MGRKKATTLEYISIDVVDKTTIKRLHRKYGVNGRLFWYELLRLLGRTKNYCLNLSDEWDLEDTLEEELFIDKEVGIEIIEQLCLWGNLDQNLWENHKIIWCQGLIDRHSEVWRKRNHTPEKPCFSADKKEPKTPKNGISVAEKPISAPESTQSKVKESKEEESKVKKRKVNNSFLSEIEISDVPENEIEFFEIAKAFQELFIKNLKEKQAPTKHQEKAKYKNYVDPIRLMMVNDGVSKEHLQKAFKFLDSPGGSFWKDNILSTSKLREKFQQLIVKSQSVNGQQQNSNQQGGASQAFREKIFKTLTKVQS